MAVEHLIFAQPLGAGSQYILFVNLVQKRVLVSMVRLANPPITMASTGSVICRK